MKQAHTNDRVECWRLPSGRETPSNRLGPQPATTRISVVKRALHVIDLHMAPVLGFVSEPGAGTVVLSSPPVADNFSWVFSYDEDAIILFPGSLCPGSRRSRARRVRKQPEKESPDSSEPSFEIPFLPWERMAELDRRVELMAAILQRERIKARTEYLEYRLRLVAQSEREVQEEEERAGPCEEECEPPQQVFIFEHFVKRSLSDQDSPTSWENMSLENRQKEIALALMDPMVQIAAMRNDIELPDVSGSCMEDFDILALAGKFVPWWKASRNIHRRDFLKREAHEASTSKAILELLSKETSENIDSDGVVKDFFESYFTSDTARYTFLKKKLFYLKRKSRIASVARISEEVENEEMTKAVEEEVIQEELETVIEAEQPVFDSIENQRDQEEQELRRREGENAQITLELIDMAREDALSREYNNSFVESDEEVEEPSLVIPKRTDFSRSYFFGNLPTHYRKVALSGWRAGSGVDNGDEEYEEEEQLERERERQRLMDEQEAERLLELERQAERARIDKEREEKAYQFRRVRQAELKKVLAHQAELEAQRKVDLEIARQVVERSQMQREDEHSRWHRDQLVRDRSGMTLEDQLAFQIRKELREAAIAKWRLEQEQLRRTPAKAITSYTIPLEEALTMDELDQEPYLARDSRKFKLLMGLPLRTLSSQKRPRIPTAGAIIAMQQQQRKLAEFGDERQESLIDTGKHAPVRHKTLEMRSLVLIYFVLLEREAGKVSFT
eukprot:jgi/Phyca11/21146/fgenesh1_pg.PHYCAscaffold_84_\